MTTSSNTSISSQPVNTSTSNTTPVNTSITNPRHSRQMTVAQLEQSLVSQYSQIQSLKKNIATLHNTNSQLKRELLKDQQALTRNYCILERKTHTPLGSHFRVHSLKKEPIREGDKHADKPQHGSICIAHIEGRVNALDRLFMSSRAFEQPLNILLPFENDVQRTMQVANACGGNVTICSVEGLRQALLDMHPHEKSNYYIPPKLAFKDNDIDLIPRNSTVLFQIELLGIANATTFVISHFVSQIMKNVVEQNK